MLSVFIATCASSIGMEHLDPDVAAALGPDIEYRVREIVQEAIKFMKHSKRERLTCPDVTHALQLHNVEQLFGYRATHQPNTYLRASATSGTLYFPQDDVVDFNKLLQTPLPPVPRDATFSVHWLAIEGVQPAIPQNPSLKKSAQAAALRKKKLNPLVKPIVAHVLSVELQKYFEEVTTAVMGSDENKLSLAVGSVTADPGLNDLLPYFCQFVADEVTKNLRNLSVLRNLMRFTGGLLASEHMHLEPYLHQLLPAILTCVVGKTLCNDPATEDHWSLRNSAAALIEKVVSSFGTAYTTLQPRITKTLVGAFLDFSKPLTTHYGAIKALCGMGEAVCTTLVFPNLSVYMPFLQAAKDEGSALRKAEAGRVWNLLLDQCVGFVKGVVAQQHSFAAQAADAAGAKAGGGGKRGRDEGPVHPSVTAAVPLVKLFRDSFGTAAFEKAAKAAKVELALF